MEEWRNGAINGTKKCFLAFASGFYYLLMFMVLSVNCVFEQSSMVLCLHVLHHGVVSELCILTKFTGMVLSVNCVFDKVHWFYVYMLYIMVLSVNCVF